ncbi:putative RNase H [Trypanosoma cruzi]|uniref:Putative RNase H n=1 Tax=Trypanosoma cruzi TaxID=5693 RepID=A0A2V2VGI5_TRYCR|nr:putative RNase H [Trypanosoma cruzi]
MASPRAHHAKSGSFAAPFLPGLRPPLTGHHRCGTSDRPSITDEEELIRERRRVSEEALALHSHRSWDTCDRWRCRRSQVSRGWNTAFIPQLIGDKEKASINCGARPCSYRTESRALLLALEKLMIPRIRHRRKTLLVVTDSQSLSSGSKQGPAQSDRTGRRIRSGSGLLTLTRAGWSVHLQFCYGHCGIHANELADQYATQTMEWTIHGARNCTFMAYGSADMFYYPAHQQVA